MSTKKANGLRSVYIALTIILAFALLAITLASYLYASQFSGELSSKQETWGAFGDFFGGTLNPILSFLTIIALLLTIVLQVDELKQARAAAESSANALSSQLKISEYQAREQSFFRFLEELKTDKSVKLCIDKNMQLSAALHLCIYKNGIEDADRKIDHEELNSYTGKAVYSGTIYHNLITKTEAIAKIINEFEEEEKTKYSKLLATYLTHTLVSVIYHISSMLYKNEFNHISKTKMIDGARDDLIFREDIAKFLKPPQRDNFKSNRVKLINSYQDWAKEDIKSVKKTIPT